MDLRWFYLIILPLANEALVQLWFHGAPLQPVRNLLRRITPFLQSAEGHLLDCPYCFSVWTGEVLAFAFFWRLPVLAFILGLFVHRISNFIHLAFSYMADLQIDLRIRRSKNASG